MTPQLAGTIKGMMTAEQVAKQLGVSAWTVLKLARAKQLPSYHFSKRTVRFKYSDVQAFIERTKK